MAGEREEAYAAAARGWLAATGTWNPDDLDGLRAAVNAVWDLAVEAGRGQAAETLIDATALKLQPGDTLVLVLDNATDVDLQGISQDLVAYTERHPDFHCVVVADAASVGRLPEGVEWAARVAEGGAG